MTVKLSDIKKLFALSSNRCAFVDCTMEIILKNIVLGEVCHIKAQSPGGPRFDSDLSSEQIHALENLILLCPTHHKIIDSDVSTYTADVLHRMKQGHEEKSSECIDIDDESLQRLLGNFNVEQNNITSIAPLAIGSNLNSTINVTVNQTANKEQVMELIKLLAHENFPVLSQKTMEEVERKLEEFRSEFSGEVIKQKENLDISKLAEPAIQKAILNAQESIAYSKGTWTSKCLSSLLVESLKKDSEDFDELIVKEVSGIIGNLSEDHVRLLTFRYFCEFLSFTGAPTWDVYRINYPKLFESIKDFKSSALVLTYLQSQKCIVITSNRRPKVPILNFVDTRIDLFPEGIKTANCEEVILRELPSLHEINQIWDQKDLSCTLITPIGIAIAISYMRYVAPEYTANLSMGEFTKHL